jgi:hypothetical protein
MLSESRVNVVGLSRLGAIIWTLLSAAGVGRVDAIDSRSVTTDDVCVGAYLPDEVGRRRSDLPLLRGHWVTQPTQRRPARQLTVITDAIDIDEKSQHLMDTGAVHLVVRCEEGTGRIGPLVVPGKSVCTFCLALTQRDSDQTWPHLWRQQQPKASPVADTFSVNMTANVAVRHVISWLTGGTPSSVNGYSELTTGGTIRTVSAAIHPQCGCTPLAA